MKPIKLYDKTGNCIGTLAVRKCGVERFSGSISGASLSPAMKSAFERQDDAINSNTLSVLDDIDSILDGFGFEVLLDDNTVRKVRNIQLSGACKITLDL